MPERAAGVFYVRAATEPRLARAKQRVDGCFHAGALASGAELHMRTLGEDYSDMRTNGPLAAAYAANLARLGRRADVRRRTRGRVAGSTDMGNVSKLVPSIHPMIAVAPPRRRAAHAGVRRVGRLRAADSAPSSTAPRRWR